MADSDESEMVGFFSRHLVVIAGHQTEGDPPKTHAFFIAGIVISVGGHWFLVTAGHCLARLEQAIRETKVEGIRLVDYIGNHAIDATSHFFDYAGALKRYFDNANGIDFGFVYLRPYYRNLLAANGVVAMDEVQWKRQPHNSDYGICWMLGVPSELVDDSDPKTVLFRSAFLPLDALSEIPEQFKADSGSGLSSQDMAIRDAMFYGRIRASYALPKNKSGEDDISGMSGGPILGFVKKGDELKYWIVAIQSCWFRDTRFVRGCPVPIIAACLEGLVREVEHVASDPSQKEKGRESI
jgi:hypothetical protein